MTQERIKDMINKIKLDKSKREEISRRILEKYSIGKIFDILRHRNSNPSEWKEYQDFCAKVRAEVKNEGKTV